MLLKKFTSIVLVSVSLGFAGCAPTTPKPDQTAAPKVLFREIQAAEFNSAYSAFTYTADEFDGNEYLDIKANKKFFSKSGKKSAALITELFKMKNDEKWTVNLMSLYVAPDYIFHDAIAVKSGQGSKSIDLVATERSDDYVSYNRISESIGNLVSDEDFADYCTILEQGDIDFRLSGTDGSFTAKMTASALQENLSGCIVYFGLLQGLIPKR